MPDLNASLTALIAKCDAATDWRDILGYDGYQVSNEGQVRSIRFVNRVTNKLRDQPLVLRQRVGTNGYMTVSVNHKTTSVHTLVLIGFWGPRPSGKEAAHLNGDKQDNRASNLAWVSHKENCSHRLLHGTNHAGERNALSRLTDAQALEILRSYEAAKPVRGKGWYEHTQAKYSVSFGCINKLVLGQAWKHVRPLTRLAAALEGR